MIETEINWPEALRAAENSAAVSELRGVLLNGLRLALRDRSDVSGAQLEDFAQDSTLRVLERLDQFAGRSKFTTWAHSIAINTAFTEWDLRRVCAQLDPRNESSARLCERLGMRKEAHLREESWFKGEWGDLAIYAVLRSDWAGQ